MIKKTNILLSKSQFILNEFKFVWKLDKSLPWEKLFDKCVHLVWFAGLKDGVARNQFQQPVLNFYQD